MTDPKRTLEVTTNIGCRIRCTYCPQSLLIRQYKALPDYKHKKRFMSLDLFANYLSTVPPSVDVHFSGFAEPWHAPDCTAMVRHTINRQHEVAVFTTTDGMTSKDIEALENIPLKRFVVHLPDQMGEMHLDITNDYIETLMHLVGSDIDNIEFLTLGIPHKDLIDVLGRQPSTRRIHSRASNIEVAGMSVGAAFTDQKIYKALSGRAITCRNNRQYSNVLLPNGNVYLCAMDYALEHRIGNLGWQTYSDIVNGQEFRKLTEMMGHPDSDILCRKCEFGL